MLQPSVAAILQSMSMMRANDSSDDPDPSPSSADTAGHPAPIVSGYKNPPPGIPVTTFNRSPASDPAFLSHVRGDSGESHSSASRYSAFFQRHTKLRAGQLSRLIRWTG